MVGLAKLWPSWLPKQRCIAFMLHCHHVCPSIQKLLHTMQDMDSSTEPSSPADQPPIPPNPGTPRIESMPVPLPASTEGPKVPNSPPETVQAEEATLMPAPASAIPSPATPASSTDTPRLRKKARASSPQQELASTEPKAPPTATVGSTTTQANGSHCCTNSQASHRTSASHINSQASTSASYSNIHSQSNQCGASHIKIHSHANHTKARHSNIHRQASHTIASQSNIHSTSQGNSTIGKTTTQTNGNHTSHTSQGIPCTIHDATSTQGTLKGIHGVDWQLVAGQFQRILVYNNGRQG